MNYYIDLHMGGVAWAGPYATREEAEKMRRKAPGGATIVELPAA